MSFLYRTAALAIVLSLVTALSACGPRTQEEMNAALIKAAAGGNKDKVLSFLQKGARINAKDAEGKTALARAVLNGHKDVIRELALQGADRLPLDKDDKTPYEYDQKKIDMSTVYEDMPQDGFLYALQAAERLSKPAIVEQVLQNGYDINRKNLSGSTPLIAAREARNPAMGAEIVEMLLNRGADINGRSSGGYTPLMFAAVDREGRQPIINVDWFLSKGADITLKDNEGLTLLHVAAATANADLVGKLIKRGMDVNVQDGNGHTPLMYAVGYRNRRNSGLLGMPGPSLAAQQENVVQWLLQSGAKTDLRDSKGRTALMIAKGTKSTPWTNDMVPVLDRLGVKE